MMELSRELDEQFDRLVNECRVSGEINQELYTEYDVKRGLRDANGKGVLTGLTEISDVLSYKSVDADMVLKRPHICCCLAVCPHRSSLEALYVL